jgi:shikimate dehydrogenase
MLPQLTAATRVFLLLGDPVEHSLSPRFQNAALRDRAIDAVYAALRCDSASVAPLIRVLCRAGGGGNVTTPHKAAAAAAIERPSAAVVRTGACNTFWGDDGVICGDNTDVHGFIVAAAKLLPSLKGASVLVLGAGGAAAAAVVAAIDARAQAVQILNRTGTRADELARSLDPDGSLVRVCRSVDVVERQSFDLVVNATSIGLPHGDALPLDLSRVGTVRAVLDMAYGHGRVTPFVAHARALGIAAGDGREMLLAQGAASFVRWFGEPAPHAAMRDALNTVDAAG